MQYHQKLKLFEFIAACTSPGFFNLWPWPVMALWMETGSALLYMVHI